MNLRKLILSLTVALGLAAPALAQTTQTQATVARVTGAATVTLPDGSTTPLTAGMKVAQGSTITTGADGDVYLESHAGYVTSIKHDSVVAVDEISVTTEGGQVKEERTMLDLKSGNLVAKLDPKKKAVNNYQVRTPKGVAAARGTVFTVSYKGGNYTIAVVNGAVTVTPPVGTGMGASKMLGVQVGAGQGTTLGVGKSAFGNAQTLATYKEWGQASDVNIQELLSVAVATVAVAAQNNIGGTTAAEAAQVAQAVFAAVPAAAEQTGALLKQSGVSSGAVADAVKAVVPASASAAFSSGFSTGTFTPSTTTTTTTAPTAPVTTPQPIDPSTISRSNE